MNLYMVDEFYEERSRPLYEHLVAAENECDALELAGVVEDDDDPEVSAAFSHVCEKIGETSSEAGVIRSWEHMEYHGFS